MSAGLDPVCAHHGKRWSEHEGGRCLYCCLCFTTLTPDECATDSEGVRWDICKDCWLMEHHEEIPALDRLDGQTSNKEPA